MPEKPANDDDDVFSLLLDDQVFQLNRQQAEFLYARLALALGHTADYQSHQPPLAHHQPVMQPFPAYPFTIIGTN